MKNNEKLKKDIILCRINTYDLVAKNLVMNDFKAFYLMLCTLSKTDDTID